MIGHMHPGCALATAQHASQATVGYETNIISIISAINRKQPKKNGDIEKKNLST